MDAGLRDAVRRMQRRAFEDAGADGARTIDVTQLDLPALAGSATSGAPSTCSWARTTSTPAWTPPIVSSQAVKGPCAPNWPDVGHLPSMERPARFLELVRDWTGSS